MEWDKALQNRMIVPQMNCSLIIVGETKDGLPLCYDGGSAVVEANEREITLLSDSAEANRIMELDRIGFIELSFRDVGTLYYTYADLFKREMNQSRCVLTFRAPRNLIRYQSRRFPRITLPERIPLTCRIVGMRQNTIDSGTPFQAEILELSGSGLSFISSVRLFYPLFLKMNFELPGFPQPLELYGEVLRLSPFGGDSYRVAAEFRNIPEAMLSIIVEYCDSFVK